MIMSGSKRIDLKIDVTPNGRRILTKTMSVELRKIPIAKNAIEDSMESSLISSSVSNSEQDSS